MGGDAEGGDGEVELVEEAEGLVDGVDDLFEILGAVVHRVGGGGAIAATNVGGGSSSSGETAVAGGGGGVGRGIHSRKRIANPREKYYVASNPGIV